MQLISRIRKALCIVLPFLAASCSSESENVSTYESLLSQQMAFNEATWARLQDLGVTQSTMLRLDFAYEAPSESAALALRATIAGTADYDLSVEFLDASTWTLFGSTQPTMVSLEILNQWVDWMITAGLQHQCAFDGWGTRVP